MLSKGEQDQIKTVFNADGTINIIVLCFEAMPFLNKEPSNLISHEGQIARFPTDAGMSRLRRTADQQSKVSWQQGYVDRLALIVASKGLLCDAVMANHADVGTTIGLSRIKQRRLTELNLQSHGELFVGQCVPFYFCPRSIMLYMYYRNNHQDLTYHGGQDPIVHLESDLNQVVDWADQHNKRWAFTSSNAGSYYFDDYSNVNQLDEINWGIVSNNNWAGNQEAKQAEFLVEHSFPWSLVSRIGVKSHDVYSRVNKILLDAEHKPHSEIKPNWYY